jgi:hypothetical protein
MTDHFKFIPDPGFGPDQIPTGHLICNRCGRRVETGIMNVSSHWRDCYPEDDGQEMNLSHFIDDYGISGKDARQVMRLEVGQTIVVQDMSVTRTR